MSTFKNPFDGLKRNRLPGMDLIPACEGGMPFVEAMAAFYFMMTHREIQHTCLIERGLKQVERVTETALGNARSFDGIMMTGFGSSEVSATLCNQEWSYLSDEDAAPYLRAAEILRGQAQIELALGTEKIFKISYGPLVVVNPSLNDPEVQQWLKNQENPNPFAGTTAESWHAMAILLFSLLHDRYKKGCRLDPDGTRVSDEHILREWKGMPDEERSIFRVAVLFTVEQMQRWIVDNKGVPVSSHPAVRFSSALSGRSIVTPASKLTIGKASPMSNACGPRSRKAAQPSSRSSVGISQHLKSTPCFSPSRSRCFFVF